MERQRQTFQQTSKLNYIRDIKEFSMAPIPSTDQANQPSNRAPNGWFREKQMIDSATNIVDGDIFS
jgi:hypothetical protein